jgi:phosphohistidine phosphatase
MPRDAAREDEMDLILWRHAEAEDEADGQGDLQRALTPRGEKQAARMALWLDRQLPESARILCSPALRCEQTVLPLGRKYKLADELAPGGKPGALLEAAHWPGSRQPVLIVGHQPLLGQALAQLLGLKHDTCPIRKGAAWWLRTRERDGHEQTVVVAVQSPDVV